MGVLPGYRSWIDPGHVAANRLPMRSPLVAHPTVEGARSGDPSVSPWWLGLDGTWRFSHLGRPEELTEAHLAGPTDTWASIEVPGHWTLQGWDHPHYTNVQMPFPGRPPSVPDENPTGVYRTTVDVPPGWMGRQIVLHVGAAEAVLYVFANGTFVASSTDSRLAAEIDLTDVLAEGPNDLALIVVRWGAVSHLEDQDHWWMAGLHRSVHLEARALVHLGDVRIDAGIVGPAPATGWPSSSTVTGALRVRVWTTFVTDALVAPGHRVRARLEDLDGTLRYEATADVPTDLRPYLYRGHLTDLRAEVPGVRPWSAEAPQRYRLVVTLLDSSGAEVESVADTVGFRTVALVDGLLTVNGAPIMVQGVNRHDHHPERGKAVTVEDMTADLLAMKRLNVNAVRCSHYPNDPRFLDLCDELGFYVVDEANIETHAWNESLCHDARYREAWLERGTRMVERDKNHPCVIAWSLGNESGYGANHDAVAGWIRRYDPSRLLHYEGAIMGRWERGAHATDLVCPMYPPLADIVTWAEQGPHDRPMVLCEYSHAMGNSNGGLMDYWEAFRSHRQLQGGFLWEWKDHGLTQVRADGRRRFAYGGQFGDEPNDANFVADGLMASDLVPHPAAQELAWVHRTVAVTAGPNNSGPRTAERSIVVENRQAFVDLDALECRWIRLVDGAGFEQGILDVAELAPGASVELPLSALGVLAEIEEGAEESFVFQWVQREPTAWAPAGHIVAWDEVIVAPARWPLHLAGAEAAGMSSLPVRVVELHPPDQVVMSAGSMEATVVAGDLRSLNVAGLEVLKGPMRLAVWRGATDNDGIKLWSGQEAKPLGRWLAAGLDRLGESADPAPATWTVADDVVIARHQLVCEGGTIHHTQRLSIVDGALVIDETVEVPDSLVDLPRIGVSLTVDGSLNDLEWWACGPHETYPDRCASGIRHRWCAAPDELPYLMPQEFGLRVGVRRLELRGVGGRGVAIVAEDPLELMASVTHHTADDLFGATDALEVVRRDDLIVHVDIAHRGLGTLSCGPDTDARFQLRAGAYRWRWSLVPLPGA